MLQNCFTKGANFEKLHNHEIYSIRTSKKARLVFTSVRFKGKSNLLVLAHLTNHEYHKCKFLKPGVLASFRSKYSDHELAWQKITEKSRAAIPYFHEDSDFNNPVKVDFHRSTFIQFSDAQGAVLGAQLPLVVSAPPGVVSPV